MTHFKRASCRVCESENLVLFLSLGRTPLANAFLDSPIAFEDEEKFPLDVYFCQNCSLVQLLDVISPEVLFRDYIYVTGTSSTMAIHNRQYARTVVDQFQLDSNSLVVEAASNDGSLLSCFQEIGVRTLGVEPATNIVKIARERGIDTINEFFNTEIATQIRQDYGPADIVIGNNVLAHVDEPRDFLLGFKRLLGVNGVAIFEIPYLVDLLDKLAYDTIYHEHLCYFSVNSLMRLGDAVGLSIIKIDHIPVHGGSLRVYAGLPEQYHTHSQEVIDWAEEERLSGLTELSCYRQFSKNVEANKKALLDMLNSIRNQGNSVAGYGAPAKGNTLLNYCGINIEMIPYTVDLNPMKVGKYTPGSHIPVLPVPALLENQPDYVLILAWNLADEIINQQKAYQQSGGKFIIPVPQPRIV